MAVASIATGKTRPISDLFADFHRFLSLFDEGQGA